MDYLEYHKRHEKRHEPKITKIIILLVDTKIMKHQQTSGRFRVVWVVPITVDGRT